MRHERHTFRPDSKEDRQTCWNILAEVASLFVYSFIYSFIQLFIFNFINQVGKETVQNKTNKQTNKLNNDKTVTLSKCNKHVGSKNTKKIVTCLCTWTLSQLVALNGYGSKRHIILVIRRLRGCERY